MGHWILGDFRRIAHSARFDHVGGKIRATESPFPQEIALMYYFETFIFYIISSSVLLVYGIGLEKVFIDSRSRVKLSADLFLLFFQIILSVAVLYYPLSALLQPHGVSFLAPMYIVLGCGLIQGVLNLASRRMRSFNASDRFYLFAIVFFSLHEGTSFKECLLISFFSMLSLLIGIVLLKAIRTRYRESNLQADFKGAPLALISLGMLFMVLHVTEASWWLEEAFK